MTGAWRNKEQLETWDFNTKKKKSEIKWDEKASTAFVYSACYSRINRGQFLLAGTSRSNEIKLFDLHNKNTICGTVPLKSAVFSCAFANKAPLFAAGGGDGQMYLMTMKKNM